MVLPRWLARFNRSVTNRVLGKIPRRWSPFVVVHHTGRRSRRPYSTLASAFPTPTGFVLPPTYGPRADWVRNTLAAGTFTIDRRGQFIELHRARLISRVDAQPFLPRPVRAAMWLLRIDWYLAGDLSECTNGGASPQ